MFLNVGIFCTVKLFKIIYFRVTGIFDIPGMPLDMVFYFQIVLMISDIRYTIEYIIYASILDVLAEQLQYIIYAIEKKTRIATEVEVDEAEENAYKEIGENNSDIAIWSTAYMHIAKSCNLVNFIFRTQLTVMLMTAASYYIGVLYASIFVNLQVEGMKINQSYAYYIFCVEMMVILYIVSRAAQELQNNKNCLRQKLCRLIVASINNENDCKAMRNLLRQLNMKSVRIEAYGTVAIDMTLMPTFVAFVTSYTIIALQFNNVV
ncbi:uncharacterized protein LOC113519153 [Galleria mellonella]|uniref:Uncharacterized protein LOC113519153 n=1 Tax=Galleria mellonella TaxID=7137 RepID=A0A6J3C394_GALME|nr:uncharacterized protein LOC113519153 [Galleria mellonella]